jgi:hypothetical protein
MSTVVPSVVITPVMTPYPWEIPPSGPESGRVYFGHGFDERTLLVTDSDFAYARDEPMAWTAALSEPANASSLRWVISRMLSGNERIEVDEQLPVLPDSMLLANEFNPWPLVGNNDGVFVMRFYRDASELAWGIFVLSESTETPLPR